jgi:hypothetical protein
MSYVLLCVLIEGKIMKREQIELLTDRMVIIDGRLMRISCYFCRYTVTECTVLSTIPRKTSCKLRYWYTLYRKCCWRD